MLKIKYMVLATLFSISLLAQPARKVQVPKPKPPEKKELPVRSIPKEIKFLSPTWYDVLRKKIPPPPLADSSMQIGDEAEINKWQKERTPEICAHGKVEAEDVSFNSFFGSILNPKLNEDQKKIISEYYLLVREEADFFIHSMKKDYSRQRPFVFMKGVTACVPTEASSSYPSGHAALSRVESLVLGEIFPAEKGLLQRRSAEIGLRRVQVGVHYPSDIAAGYLLADLVYAEFSKSSKYRESVKKVISEMKFKK